MSVEVQGIGVVTRKLLTVPEAAQSLGIGRSLAYELVLRGTLRSVRIRGCRRVPVDALDDFIRELMEAQKLSDPTLGSAPKPSGRRGPRTASAVV